MISICICEDEEYQRDRLRQIIQECIDEEGLGFEIRLCSGRVSEVMGYIEDKPSGHTAFFLDIGLQSGLCDGIELGRLIRKADIACDLVYLTAHSEKAVLTYDYELNCADFIVKTEDIGKLKERIKACLVKIQNQVDADSGARSSGGRVLQYRHNNIYQDKILYIEASMGRHRIIVHYENEYLEMRGSLAELAGLLPEYFCFSHRSIIVNTNKITRIDVKERKVFFREGLSCDGSLKMLRALKKAVAEVSRQDGGGSL